MKPLLADPPGRIVLMLLLMWGVTLAQPGSPSRLVVPDHLELIRDVHYCLGGGRVLSMDILRPRPQAGAIHPPRPAVVWIHGGGWRSGNKESGHRHLLPLAEAGFFTASIEYRLSGEAIFPAQIEDVKCAIRYLRARATHYGLDPGNIGVWGGSAGGHLAALLGTSGDEPALEGNGGWAGYSSRVQAVVSWFGPSDFTRMNHPDPRKSENQLLGGRVSERLELARLASPVSHISPDDPPFLIQHGARDAVVALEQSQWLYLKLREAGVETTLTVFPTMPHGGTAFTSRANYRRIVAFFRAHLGLDVLTDGRQAPAR